MFSRCSHIFPQAGAISRTAFAFSVYNAMPPGPQNRAIAKLQQHSQVVVWAARASKWWATRCGA
ncbi:hypothetical protein BDV97DRAFT_345872 [Delphinella strobiligena]|nr:hypothetical protein BDV97DRAFT_345872 [Delphinella strobiligena]